MEQTTEQLEQLMAFIREHRSNEQNFQLLHSRMEEELALKDSDSRSENYLSSLSDLREKQANDYQQQKKIGGTAWSEYEKFVSEFERIIIAEQKA